MVSAKHFDKEAWIEVDKVITIGDTCKAFFGTSEKSGTIYWIGRKFSENKKRSVTVFAVNPEKLQYSFPAYKITKIIDVTVKCKKDSNGNFHEETSVNAIVEPVTAVNEFSEASARVSDDELPFN